MNHRQPESQRHPRQRHRLRRPQGRGQACPPCGYRQPQWMRARLWMGCPSLWTARAGAGRTGHGQRQAPRRGTLRPRRLRTVRAGCEQSQRWRRYPRCCCRRCREGRQRRPRRRVAEAAEDGLRQDLRRKRGEGTRRRLRTTRLPRLPPLRRRRKPKREGKTTTSTSMQAHSSWPPGQRRPRRSQRCPRPRCCVGSGPWRATGAAGRTRRPPPARRMTSPKRP